MNTSDTGLDPLAKALLEHFLIELAIPLAETTPLRRHGLPDTTIDVVDANLILSVTPIEVPFFRDQMMRVADDTARDVVMLRSGTHPETLNALELDAVVATIAGPHPFYDLSYFRAGDGTLHLVPNKGGPFISLVPRRVEIAMQAPFLGVRDRSYGREKAAAEIVRRLR